MRDPGTRPLRPDDSATGADETPPLPALRRRHDTVPPGPGRPGLVEFDYLRGGTLAYLAAWDVHHAKLFDRVEQTTGIIPFGRLVEQVMNVEPYRSARRVFWIVDNGSSHAGKTSIADAMVVTSGRSNRHVTSIAENAVEGLHKAGLKGIRVEGKKNGDWVRNEAGDVIVHVFGPEVRAF